MNRVLIVFGSTDGQTAKIANFLGRELREHNLVADVYDSALANPDPRDYCGVIVAASVHAGGYQRSVRRWVREHAPSLKGKVSAFVSVCLGVLQDDPMVQRDLARIQLGFFERTGWTPPWLKPVAGALLYTRYHLLKRMLMRSMARKAGGDTDITRDFEYTDWDDLRRYARAFAATCRTLRAHQPAA